MNDAGSGVQGTIYLLHFDKPLGHAKHYLGWASSLDSRLARHAAGTGARILQVCRERGITWRLVRTWSGDRHLERRKKHRGHSRMCPECNGKGLTNKQIVS